ncbi:MAG TPA: COX15/CtaA family protein [Pyrinomonadaceae bacterium]|jgi:heme A synthase|nr:COX15/CtaA family protein [Pyrinomonadaceae bacterium]
MKLNRLAVYAWLVVAANLFVIVWGAYVRASFSGDGCGSHWPLCNGEVLPTTGLLKTIIELTHRLTSGVALLLVVGLVWRTRRLFPRGHRIRRGAFWSLVFILIEALIGAALVKFELVAGNASIARAFVMSIHLVNTFVLLSVLSLTAWWAMGGEPVRPGVQGKIAAIFAIGLCGTLLIAVSGAVAALGDTLFPVNSLAEGIRQDLSATAHFLVRLRGLHPLFAVGIGCYAVAAASYVNNFLRPGLAHTKRLTSILTTLFLLQIAAGILNFSLLAPVWLQLTHLLLADLFWIALVLNSAAALAPEPAAVQQHDKLNLQAAMET